jgi:hypothetical protein
MISSSMETKEDYGTAGDHSWIIRYIAIHDR